MLDTKLKKITAVFGLLTIIFTLLNIYFWYKYTDGSWYHDALDGVPNSGCLQFTGKGFPSLQGRLYSPNGRVLTKLEDSFLIINKVDSEFDNLENNVLGMGGHAWLTLNPFSSIIKYSYEITRNKGADVSPQFVEKGLYFKWQKDRCI